MTAFSEFLERQAPRYGDREALRVNGVARSYQELLAAVFALAAGLARAGVTSRDRVATMMDASSAAVDAWLASAVIGCIEIPLNTKYRGDLLDYLIADSEATVIICDAAHVPAVTTTPLSRSRVRTLIINSPDILADDEPAGITSFSLSDMYDYSGTVRVGLPDDGAVVLYTSGTTGPSKGVIHSQRSCLRLAEYVARVCDYTADDALLNFFPLYHQNARYTGLVTALAAGGRFQLDSKFSSRDFWRYCDLNEITAFNYLGSVLTMILSASGHLSAEQARDHSVKTAYGAGAPRAVWEKFEQRFGVQLVEAYGLTEAPMVTVSTSPRVSPVGSAGREGDLFELAVLDPHDRPAAPGEVGEIAVRPKVPDIFMLGYHGREVDTLQAVRNLWFHTGDRGWLSGEGDL